MQPDPLRTFVENVRRLRQERGLSQAGLADQADLNMSDVSRIEKHKREPGLRVIVKVARGLSVPIGELFDGVETVKRGGTAR